MSIQYNPASGASQETLAPAQRAERERMLELQHRDFLRSLATSRTVPSQQSSVAGASGTTNQRVRVAEEQEAERQLKLRAAAEAVSKDKAFLSKQAEKIEAIKSKQAKKRQKRMKRLSAKKDLNPSGSDDSGDSGSEDDDLVPALQSGEGSVV